MLSQEEELLVTRADWIHTKNRIMQKVRDLLSSLLSEQQRLVQGNSVLPDEVIHTAPRISKGENYKGLPYLVADYPRIFQKENVFAIRTLFWWGHFFSITLHLSGYYKTRYEKNLASAYPLLCNDHFSVCINEEEWEHHFEEDNYRPAVNLNSAEFEEAISRKKFVKLAKKIPLQQWNDIENKLARTYNQLIHTLAC